MIVSNRDVYESAFKKGALIKLHGDVKDILMYKDSDCKIFSRKEYAYSINKNASLLARLENDLKNQNIIFIGCSLDDEFDILSISKVPLKQESDSRVKKIFCTNKKPGIIYEAKLKEYNITDIVVVDDYTELYHQIYLAWIESQKIQEDELQDFCGIPTLTLSPIDRNADYFYFGKRLFNRHENKITYPYYFIIRNIVNEVVAALNSASVILAEGNSLSGKSYFLFGIYSVVKDQCVYIFDGSARIRQSSFDNLMMKKDALFLFDIGALTPEQFSHLLDSKDLLKKNNSKAIVALSIDKSDMLGIVKLKLINKEINEEGIRKFSIQKHFDNDEINNINKLLPRVGIPVFLQRKTILDNVISSHKNMNRGKYNSAKLEIKNYKYMVALLVLITQEKIYTYDQVRYDIAAECVDLNLKYKEMIEEISTVLVEKDANNLSNYKYVLNAKFWLQNELAKFAANTENYGLICDAYRYLVDRIIKLNGAYTPQSRESYREYILFDSINSIFVYSRKENLPLVIKIYEQLNSVLSEDYQFQHQYAKGLFLLYKSGLTTKSDRSLSSANEKIIVAESLINKVIENASERAKRRLEITHSRMCFTKSLILCEFCEKENYSNIERVKKIISTLYLIFVTKRISVTFMQGLDTNLIVQKFFLKIRTKFEFSNDVKKQMGDVIKFMMKSV